MPCSRRGRFGEGEKGEEDDEDEDDEDDEDDDKDEVEDEDEGEIVIGASTSIGDEDESSEWGLFGEEGGWVSSERGGRR